MSTRKHTHNALRPDLDDLYRLLFEHMNSGVAIYEAVEDGRDFVFVDFNSAGEQIEDISRRDLVGRRVTGAFPGVEEFGLLEVFRRVWKTGEAEHHPVQFYEDGRVAGWRENYVFKLPETGNIVAIYDDPTELRCILDSLFGFVAICLPNRVLIDANRTPFDATGVKREDAIGKPMWETPWFSHSPAMQDRVRRALEQAAAGETVREDVTVRLGPDAVITMDASFSPLRDQAGNIHRLIGFGVDITERMLAEVGLRKSEARLANAQRIARIGNWDWEIVTGELHWSDEIYRIFGLEPQQFGATYEAFLDAVHPEDRSMVEGAVTAALEEDAPYSIEHRIVLPGGETRIVHEQAEVERDEGGTPVAMRGTVQDITERRRAEDALRQHAQIVDQIHDAVVSTDCDGVVATWNKGAERLFGYTSQEAVGRHISFVYPDDERGYLLKQVIEPTERKGQHETEVRMRRKSGEDFYAHLSDSVLRDAQGKVIGRIGYSIDITARKLAEEAAREGGARIRGILANVADGVITMTEDGLIESVNPAAERMFGYSASEMVGNPVTMLMTSADRMNHDGYVRQYVQTGKSRILGEGARELKARRKDGSTFPIGLAVSEMQTGGDRVFIGAIRDITVRKQAEREIERNTALLRDTLNSMGQGLIVIDGTLTVLAANHRVIELLQVPEDLLAEGADFGKLIEYATARGDYGPGDPEEIIARQRSQALGTDAHTFDRTMPDGTHMEARANPRPTGGFVITYTDITERVQARETMRVAKEEAELSDRSKSEFLANMSHELRTPLNAIIGFSQVLQDELKGPLGDPAYRQYVRDIHESGTLLLSLINDILDLSKIEAGKLELQDAKQNIPEIVGACRRIIEGRAKEAGVMLDTRLSGGLPHLQVDERALKQILLNLLSNAVKFTPEGGSIAVDARIDDDGCFAIIVSDTGIGIAPAEIHNALSNFGQVENYLTREKQGTGLGLPLSKSLAEAHGGTLELESELGRGTTVTVRFPAERVGEASVAMVRSREAGAA